MNKKLLESERIVNQITTAASFEIERCHFAALFGTPIIELCLPTVHHKRRGEAVWLSKKGISEFLELEMAHVSSGAIWGAWI